MLSFGVCSLTYVLSGFKSRINRISEVSIGILLILTATSSPTRPLFWHKFLMQTCTSISQKLSNQLESIQGLISLFLTSVYQFWVHLINLKVILIKAETTINAIPVFWSNKQHNVTIIMSKQKINVIYSLFGLYNDNIGSSLCYNLVG